MRHLIAGLAMASVGAAQAVTVLSEGFDNVATLPVAGWVQTNNSSTPVGTGWFQGNAGVFPAAAGAPGAYIAANFLGTSAAAGAISEWLLTPVLTLDATSTLSFAVRNGGEGYLDTLEVRFSAAGASTNVGTTSTSIGDFTTLVGTFSSSFTPTDWTTLTASFSNLVTPTSGRVAFRYVVSNVATAGNYLGIDSVVITAAVVPEPTSLALMALGVAGLLLRRRHTS